MCFCVCSGVFVGVVGRVCGWVGVCGWWMLMVRVGDGRFNPCVVYGSENFCEIFRVRFGISIEFLMNLVLNLLICIFGIGNFGMNGLWCGIVKVKTH